MRAAYVRANAFVCTKKYCCGVVVVVVVVVATVRVDMSKLVDPAALKNWASTPPRGAAAASAEDEDDDDPLAAMAKAEVRFPKRNDLNEKIVLWCVHGCIRMPAVRGLPCCCPRCVLLSALCINALVGVDALDVGIFGGVLTDIEYFLPLPPCLLGTATLST